MFPLNNLMGHFFLLHISDIFLLYHKPNRCCIHVHLDFVVSLSRILDFIPEDSTYTCSLLDPFKSLFCQRGSGISFTPGLVWSYFWSTTFPGSLLSPQMFNKVVLLWMERDVCQHCKAQASKQLPSSSFFFHSCSLLGHMESSFPI